MIIRGNLAKIEPAPDASGPVHFARLGIRDGRRRTFFSSPFLFSNSLSNLIRAVLRQFDVIRIAWGRSKM